MLLPGLPTWIAAIERPRENRSLVTEIEVVLSMC